MPVVLVVDDEEEIRSLIRENLEPAGYTVLTAEHGARALEIVQEQTPDAIFLDLMMPEADGFTVLERLKRSARADLSEIPVFMVTGMGEMENRIRGGIEGALRYITKPFDPRELVEALDEVLAPGSLPERVQRRKVQTESLEALARMERDGATATGPDDEPRVRLTRLEHAPGSAPTSPRITRARGHLSELTDKQRDLLTALAAGASVTAVAAERNVSRSNVYASLRRIGRRLQVESTNELLALLRQGLLLEPRARP